MVIQRNYDEYNLFHIAKIQMTEANQQNSVATADFALKEVRVSISREGLEKYRQSMVETQKQQIEDQENFEETFQEDKILVRHRNMLWGKINEITETKKEERQYSGLTSEDKIQSLLEAYAELYDEIIRGYEDGTREIYIQDPESPKGYRLLTKEEDLEQLNSAFKNASESYEIEFEKEHMLYETWIEQYKKLAASIAIQRGRNDKVMEYLEKAGFLEEQMKNSWWPENLKNNLMTGSRLFVNQYKNTGDKNVIDDIYAAVFEKGEAL